MSYSESERKLTNDDFRKLFMTPRHPGDGGPSSRSGGDMGPPSAGGISSSIKKHVDKEKFDKRKKKKQFYSKIKKEEDDAMAELAKKYRDRAKERRDGGLPDQQQQRESELLTSQGAYRAVAPDFRGNVDAAERRKQMIQESKFLGGDMEHTHLVKGLDYALLQKVKSEIDVNPEDGEEEEQEVVEQQQQENQNNHETIIKAEKKDNKVSSASGSSGSVITDLESTFKTKLARNINRVLFKTTLPERNELFIPGRMAYVMDLEEEYAESDIPTTLIRSKADCPLEAEGLATLTTNDIVINKLAQILSYLRQGTKSSKKHRKNNKEVNNRPSTREEKVSTTSTNNSRKHEDDSIYGDIGDYVPTLDKSSSKNRDRGRERERERGDRDRDRDNRDRRRGDDKERSSKKAPYFEKPADEDDRGLILEQANQIVDQTLRKRDREAWNDADGPQGGDKTFGSILKKDDKSMSRTQKLLSKINSQPEGYAECYPGFDEMHDAIDDSDDEADFSKMDPGKTKGKVGRWDFDTAEEYGEYMSNKEALPKAAFQFGVKMNDGRKTRKVAKTDKQEKQQLDKQWQQIQGIIEKRKAAGGGGAGEPVPKTPRV